MDATPNQEPESVREEPKRRRRGTFVRYLVASLALVLLLGLLAGVKVSQIATLISFAQDAEEQGPPPEAVSAATVSRESWEDTLAAVGTVAADEDLAISSEVPGIVARIEFESGAVVERGDVLVVLDSGTEHADLRSAQAAHALANSNAGRTAELASRGVQSLDVLERAEAERVSADARVMGLRAMLSKKTIRAPFGGRVGIREVHVGQYVAPGTVLTTLGSLDQLFVDFTVPQEHLADVSVETPIRVRLGRESEPIAGAISAIEPRVDATTRAIGLRATVRDGTEALRPGMFVSVEVVLPERRTLVVPATAVVHEPYGDSVFIIEDIEDGAPGARRTPDGQPIRAVRQSFVRTGRMRGDFIEVIEGVREGQEVVSAGAFKLRNEARIVLTDDVGPSPELEPRPENR